MKLLQELVQYTDKQYISLFEILDDVVDQLNRQGRLDEASIKSIASDLHSKGGKVNSFKGARGNVKGAINGAKDFFKANPGLTVAAGAMALDAYGRHKSKKEQERRNTIQLHARDKEEQKMMTSIVDALKKQGKFKIEKVQYERGGRTWTLKRAK